MRTYNLLMVILSCVAFLMSCEKDDNPEPDFYTTNYRIGLWVSPDKKDTLEFINASNMLRKGFYYEHEEYSYTLENDTLFMGLPDTESQSQHPILEAEGEKVVLDNMYITTGFIENSGVFIKQ